MSQPPIAIVGPTASGKSSVALAAAVAFGDADLVSVDSMQVYRGMDIGTAKPTQAEQAAIRHHLIDLVDPSAEFTVAEFQRAYRGVRRAAVAQRRRLILVGGTGLYHRAVIDDFDIPGEWPELRAELTAQCLAGGLDAIAALHARLSELDPVTAERTEPTNARRVVRALEVSIGSGRPFSSFGPGLGTYPASGVTQFGLRWDRVVLTERIVARVDQMLVAGLLDEVTALAQHPISRTARQAIGYKELLDHLEGTVSLDAAVAAIVLRTRQFAIRQIRWFERDPRVHWIDITTDPVAEAVPIVTALNLR